MTDHILSGIASGRQTISAVPVKLTRIEGVAFNVFICSIITVMMEFAPEEYCAVTSGVRALVPMTCVVIEFAKIE
jgi:hypothetical protein